MGYDIYAADTYRQPYESVEREEDYFRANISGMGWLAARMELAGMLCHAPGPSQQEWDALPKYDENAADDEFAEHGGRAYAEASDKLLALHRGECPGIPEHPRAQGLRLQRWLVGAPR